MVGSDWSISYISQTEYASAIKEAGTGERTTFHDGQVVFSVSFDGPTSEFNPTGASDAVHELAKEFGELRAFTAQPSHYPTLEYRAEYYKITDAQKALNSATKQKPRLIGVSTLSHHSVMTLITDTFVEMDGHRRRDAKLHRSGCFRQWWQQRRCSPERGRRHEHHQYAA